MSIRLRHSLAAACLRLVVPESVGPKTGQPRLGSASACLDATTHRLVIRRSPGPPQRVASVGLSEDCPTSAALSWPAFALLRVGVLALRLTASVSLGFHLPTRESTCFDVASHWPASAKRCFSVSVRRPTCFHDASHRRVGHKDRCLCIARLWCTSSRRCFCLLLRRPTDFGAAS